METDQALQEYAQTLWRRIRHGWGEEEIQWFDRMHVAMECAEEGSGLGVFAQQFESSRAMRFMVACYEEFWRIYQFRAPEEKRFYEVIREGMPCKLYFDLEFEYEGNEDRLGKEEDMMKTFVGFIMDDFQDEFSLGLSYDHVIDLDSSSLPVKGEKQVSAKFSRHLIFTLPPGYAFENNLEVGEYVQKLECKLKQLRQTRSEVDLLFCTTSSGETELFVDNSVYTRNRLFRLYLSSKSNKHKFLVPSRTFEKDQTIPLACQDDKFIFMQSLVCNFPEPPKHFLQCIPCIHGKRIRSRNVSSSINSGSSKRKSSSQDLPTASSSFPLLDRFVWSLVQDPGLKSCVRKGDTLLYFGGSRFCERVGRKHKSNHVYHVADLRQGVVYQKCTDTDCSGFRSVPVPIPRNLLPALDFELSAQDWSKISAQCP